MLNNFDCQDQSLHSMISLSGPTVMPEPFTLWWKSRGNFTKKTEILFFIENSEFLYALNSWGEDRLFVNKLHMHCWGHAQTSARVFQKIKTNSGKKV